MISRFIHGHQPLLKCLPPGLYLTLCCGQRLVCLVYLGFLLANLFVQHIQLGQDAVRFLQIQLLHRCGVLLPLFRLFYLFFQTVFFLFQPVQRLFRRLGQGQKGHREPQRSQRKGRAFLKRAFHVISSFPERCLFSRPVARHLGNPGPRIPTVPTPAGRPEIAFAARG